MRYVYVYNSLTFESRCYGAFADFLFRSNDVFRKMIVQIPLTPLTSFAIVAGLSDRPSLGFMQSVSSGILRAQPSKGLHADVRDLS